MSDGHVEVAEDATDTRVCNSCGKEWPRTFYYPGRAHCKECARARQRARGPEDPEKHRERNREWRARNPQKHREQARKHMQRKRAQDPGYGSRRTSPHAIEKHGQEERARWRGRQSETVSRAARHRSTWGGWELELAADKTRTAKDVAAQLGRTLAAVQSMRHQLRADPKTIDRAGIAQSGRL